MQHILAYEGWSWQSELFMSWGGMPRAIEA